MCHDREGREKDKCGQEDKPSQADTCNLEPCPAWNFGDWGKVRLWQDGLIYDILIQCDRPCDGGVSHRLVRCQDHLGQNLPDQQCNLNNKPRTSQTCNTAACLVVRRRRFLWKVGKWSQVGRLYLFYLISQPSIVWTVYQAMWERKKNPANTMRGLDVRIKVSGGRQSLLW